MRLNVGRGCLLVAILVAWQYFVGDPRNDKHVLIDEFYVSSPSGAIGAILRWHGRGVLFESIWSTTYVSVVGFAIGSIAGLSVGYILGSVQLLSDLFRGYIQALNAVPRLAMVPLFLLWFGLGHSAKIALVTVIVFFLMYNNTYAGVRDVDRRLIDQLRIMGASVFQVFIKVTLPNTMTWVVTGVRIAVPYALVAAVTAEMLAPTNGLGALIVNSANQFYTEGIFGGIFVLVVLALLVQTAVTATERYILRWKPDRLNKKPDRLNPNPPIGLG